MFKIMLSAVAQHTKIWMLLFQIRGIQEGILGRINKHGVELVAPSSWKQFLAIFWLLVADLWCSLLGSITAVQRKWSVYCVGRALGPLIWKKMHLLVDDVIPESSCLQKKFFPNDAGKDRIVNLVYISITNLSRRFKHGLVMFWWQQRAVWSWAY